MAALTVGGYGSSHKLSTHSYESVGHVDSFLAADCTYLRACVTGQPKVAVQPFVHFE